MESLKLEVVPTKTVSKLVMMIIFELSLRYSLGFPRVKGPDLEVDFILKANYLVSDSQNLLNERNGG